MARIMVLRLRPATRRMHSPACCSEAVNEQHLWKNPYRPAVACVTLQRKRHGWQV